MKQASALLLSLTTAFFLCSCGDDGGSGPGPASSESENSSAQDLTSSGKSDTGAVVKNKTISGVSQKGPFVKGSSVTVQELDGESLAQTGKSFKGKILNDRGEFSISSVTLASQYALLEVSGYYKNEVSGAKSSSPIALSALADLSERETVNINLLTHLELDRALRLVAEGATVAEAKKQAEREVLAAFGVSGQVAGAEELDLFSEGNGNAALLAISVLLQGDLSEAEFTERLAAVAADLEADGDWDDAATRTRIADWAFDADLDSVLAHVEKFMDDESGDLVFSSGLAISSGHLVSSASHASYDGSHAHVRRAPEFEPVVRDFWRTTYGLPKCDAASEGALRKNANASSRNHGVSYVCEDEAWRVATTTEVLLGAGCTPYVEVEELTPVGKVHCSTTHYVGEWVPVQSSYGSLTDSRDGAVYKTIAIGPQRWMAENLRYDYKVGGATYDNGLYYGDGSDSAGYGRLYTWGAAMDTAATGCGYGAVCAVSGRVRGICPEGWHLPAPAEWETLIAFAETYYLNEVGGDSDPETDSYGGVSAVLKTKNAGWLNDDDAASHAWYFDNVLRFDARPAGKRNVWIDGDREQWGGMAYFWTSAEEAPADAGIGLSSAGGLSSGSAAPGSLQAIGYTLEGGRRDVRDTTAYKYEQFSIRCVEDRD